jgi:phosphatidylserine/phosphatidylglycerophosphate/cardiolipin synthase-like enzyme
MSPFQAAILRQGRNCWRTCKADRASVLVDGETYFSHLNDALLLARRSILILGWDFDGRIKLRPQDDGSLALGPLLRDLVEKNPDLHVDILVWSVAVWHAPSSPAGLLIGEDWQSHPRIRLRLDTRHPIYAAHHQKIVCIDETLAFCGGIDLTVMRWDSSDHRVNDPLRRNPDNEPYGSVHDIQMVVQGEAAVALAEIARERWQRAGLALSPHAEWREPLWPPSLSADFTNTPVALARTFPCCNNHEQIEEIAPLTQDIILSARTYIYIENQYLTAPDVGKALARKLAEPNGPHVVIVVTKASRGRAEQFVMGRNRERLLRRLTRADRYKRLRIYYPSICEAGDEHPIHVHAKLMIVDDRILRVGSANLNNRSMGLDTECDLVIEARDEETRRGICAIRERLMAEHLGTTAAVVRETAIAARSLLIGIDQLNHGKRQLKAIEVRPRGPIRPVWGTILLDPRRPIRWLGLLQRGLRSLRWPTLPRIQQYFRQSQKG